MPATQAREASPSAERGVGDRHAAVRQRIRTGASKIDVMTQELLERIDYEVCGSGPNVVLVPGRAAPVLHGDL